MSDLRSNRSHRLDAGWSALMSSRRPATAIGCALTAFATASALGALPAAAGPKGGHIVAGQGTITTSGSETTIRQGTDRIVIDWRSFDIDANEAVEFLQPGDSSIALNRVLDNLPTNIRGQLLANGNVWIVNQSGIVFHAGSMVDVGGLLATTSDISNADFMAGNYRFDRPGNPDAKIINEGSITFGQAGLAAFVAPGVENRGVIAGKMGKVVIAGAETFAVDLAGDGMWAFTMGESGSRVRAKNTGRIHNPGGYILISATVAQGMVDSQVSVGGVVEATTAEMKNGKIVLSGGTGHVEVSGTLDATGTEAGAIGGGIEVTGETVHLTGTAQLDVSGDAGGGTIKVGGDYQGGGTLKTASRTLVSEGAALSANAIGEVGNGGEVIVWADETTGFFGAINAQGGSAEGNGGFAEVSGKDNLIFEGIANLGATNGEIGQLLLDPDNISIIAVGDDDAEIADNEILFGDGGAVDFTLSAAVLSASTAAVTLQAANDITVAADVTMTQDLTLQAGNDIVLNADITALGQDLVLAADVDFSGGGGAAADGMGTINFAGGGALSAGNVTLTVGDAVALGDVTTTLAFGLTTTNDDATQLAGTAINVTGITTLDTGTGDLTLDAAANEFADAVTSTGNAISITDATDLVLGPTVAGDALSVTAGGYVLSNNALQITGTTTADAGGTVRLYNGGNVFGGAVSVTDADAVTIYSTSSFEVGDITAAYGAPIGSLFNSFAGDLTLSGDIDLGATAQTLLAGSNIYQTGGGVVADLAILSTGGGGVANLVGMNDLTRVRVATGGAASVNNISALSLDSVITPSITVTAGGDITQEPGRSIQTNTGVFTAQDGMDDFDIALDHSGNDFVNDVSATGGNVAITDVNALTLNDVVASDTLTVDAGGALTQGAGTSIQATGNVNFTAQMGPTDYALTLDQAGNDFEARVNAVASDVTISDDNALTLGTVTASGGLTLSSGGALTDTDGAAITVTGLTGITIASGAAITLDNATHDFGGAVGVTGTPGDLTLSDANTLTIGTVTVADTGNDIVTLAATDEIAITGTINAADTVLTNLVAGSIYWGGAGAGGLYLSDASTDFVSGPLQIQSLGAVLVDGVTFGNDATVTAAMGSAVQFNGAASTFGADLSVVSGDDITQAAALAVTGQTDLDADGFDITLTNVANDFTGAVTAMGEVISLADASALTLDDISAGGTLTATALGALTLTGDHALDGTVIASGYSISGTFSNTDTVTFGALSVTGAAGTIDLDVTDQSIILSDAVSTNGGDDLVQLSAGGDDGITQTGGTVVAGQLTLDGGGNEVTLEQMGNDVATLLVTQGSDVSFVDANSVALGNVAATGTLDVTAARDITDAVGGTLTVGGVTTLTAAGNVTLDNAAAHDFSGAVNASGEEVVLRSLDALTLGTVAATGGVPAAPFGGNGNITITADTGAVDLTGNVTAGGAAGDLSITGNAVTQSGGIVTADNLRLDPRTGSAALEQAGNDVTSLTAVQGTVSLVNQGALQIESADVTALTIDAGGAVTQANTISVAGVADVTADGAITLNNVGNDFGGAVNGDATSIVLTDANDISLGTIVATDDLTVVAGGAGDVTQMGTGLNVADQTSLTAGGDVVLNVVDNALAGQVDASAAGSITLTNDRATALGTVAAGTDLTVTSAGTISDTGALAITAGGTTTLAAEDAGSRFDIALANGAHDFTGTVNAAGQDIALSDTNAIILGNVAANGGGAVDATIAGNDGDLTVTSGGAATQTADGIAVDGATDVTAAGAVTLTTANNDFGDVVDATGADVALATDQSLTLGAVTATGDLTVDAGGAITDTGGSSIDAAGTATFAAEAGGDVFDVTLDNDTNADRHSFGSTLNATGADIVVVSQLGIEVGDISATADGAAVPGDLTLTARGGAISTAAGGQVVVDGLASLTAEIADGTSDFAIILDQGDNRFDNDGADLVGGRRDGVTFGGEAVSITSDTSDLYVFDSRAGGDVALITGADAEIDRLDAAGNDVIVSTGGPNVMTTITDVVAGTLAVNAGGTLASVTPIEGTLTISNFALDGLRAFAGTSIDLTNGDAGAELTLGSPIQRLTAVTADAFGGSVDFNALTGSTADLLVLDRIAIDGDFNAQAGEIRFGFLDVRNFGGLNLIATIGDVAKRADADIDFAAADDDSFTIGGARGAADTTVMLDSFDRLLTVEGDSFLSAANGNVVATRAFDGATASEVDFGGAVSVTSGDRAALEDVNNLQLGTIRVGGDFAARSNTDNSAGGTDTIEQDPFGLIRVDGTTALITGEHDGSVNTAALADVRVGNADSNLNDVQVIADNVTIRDQGGFDVRQSAVDGDLTLGGIGARVGGDLTVSDVAIGGTLGFDVAGDVDLSRVTADTGLTGAADGNITASDLVVSDDSTLSSAGGDVTLSRFALQDFDVDAAGDLVLADGDLGNSLAGTSAASGAISLDNLVTGDARFDAADVITADGVRADGLVLNGDAGVSLGTVSVTGALLVTATDGAITTEGSVNAAPDDIVIAGVGGGDLGFDSSPLVTSDGAADTANLRVNDSIGDGVDTTITRTDFDRQIAVGGDTTLTAQDAITFARQALPGALHNQFSGTVDATSTNGSLTIETVGALALGNVSVGAGPTTLRSNSDNGVARGAGGITQTGTFAVAGDATLITGDHEGAAISDPSRLSDVVLNTETNSFGGTLSVIADNAAIAAGTGDIELSDSRAAGGLDLALAGAGTLSATDVAADDIALTSGGDIELGRVGATGDLTATAGGDLSATDLNIGESSTLGGAEVVINRAALGDATITAGSTARLGEVVGQVISVEAGSATIADLQGTDVTLTTSGDTTADRLAADNLTVTSTIGAADISDVVLGGDARISAETGASLSRASVGALDLVAGAGATVSDLEATSTTLSAGADLTINNLRSEDLSADAQQTVTADRVQVESDVSLTAQTGDINIGSLTAGGDLMATATNGTIAATATGGDLTAATIAAPTTSDPGFSIAGTRSGIIGSIVTEQTTAEPDQALDGLAPIATAQTLAAAAQEGQLIIGGSTNLDAGGDILLGDNGAAGGRVNRFDGEVGATAGGAIVIDTDGDLTIGNGGLSAGTTIRAEAGGAITETGSRQISAGQDAQFTADGDILLGGGTHDIGGAVSLDGGNVAFAETGSIDLGPVRAAGDLTLIAGSAGTAGDAAIRQTSSVTVLDSTPGEAAGSSTTTGAIIVEGNTVLSTGLDMGLSLMATGAGAQRDVRLNNEANVLGGTLSITRIAGDLTVAEEQAGAPDDANDNGVLQIRNFEVGGSSTITTADDVLFVGRLTSLEDSVADPDRVARPEPVNPTVQANLNLADDDLRLFISDDETLTIRTDGDVRFDRPIDGDNDEPSIGSSSIGSQRDDLGGLTIIAGADGADGEVRFRDFVGATNPLGDVTITAGNIFSGFTFADDLPVSTPPSMTPDNRFLFDPAAPNDFFYANDLSITTGGTFLAATPAGQVDLFVLNDAYFGINVASLDIGENPTPQFIEAFGFIDNTRQRSGGLFPTGPRDDAFEFNDCVIGDVSDCSNIPTPNIINQVLIVTPTVLGVDEEDLLELFGSFGNEELWGVPQSFFSDVVSDCDEEDAACNDE